MGKNFKFQMINAEQYDAARLRSSGGRKIMLHQSRWSYSRVYTSMKRTLLLLTILWILPLCDLVAQFGEDDNLYIPPTIKVGHPWSDRSLSVEAQESIYPARFLPLPIIFFDDPGEWVIPKRYQLFNSSGAAFDYADTNAIIGWVGATGKYREILNIVGYRMTRDTGIVLTLRGGWSSEPGEDSLLGRERALVVREYLQNIWGIDTARLRVLPPTTTVDSASNTLLQEEARRVVMKSSDSILFSPVDFSYRIISPLSMGFRFTVTPNLDPSDVSSIEIRILDHRKELLAWETIPGNPDSSVYRYRANWWMHEERSMSTPPHILIEARVVTVDGRYRSSDQVLIPIEEDRDDYTDGNVRRKEYGEIPLFEPGDTVLSTAQKLMITEYVHLMDSLNALSSRSGLFIAAQGEVELAENPLFEPADVDAQVSRQIDERALYSYDFNSDLVPNEQKSQLIITMPYEESYADQYDRERMEEEREAREKELQAEMEAEMAVQQQQLRVETEREKDVDDAGLLLPFGADSLANARARAVVAYVRDTLGVEVLNGGLPEGVEKLEGREMGSIRTTGLIPYERGGTYAMRRPEERWYGRKVNLYIETAETFDEIVEQTTERIERQKRRRSEQTDSMILDGNIEVIEE